MPLDMLPFKKFAYRNSLNMQTFNVSSRFVYITTHNEIHQYKRSCPARVSCMLPFKPLLTFLHASTYFICSQTDLYYLRGALNHIMPIAPLALNFEYKGLLVSISESLISRIELEDSGAGRSPDYDECRASDGCTPAGRFRVTTMRLSSDNGICSAQCNFGSKLVLGFENGVIGCIESSLIDGNGTGEVSLEVLSELGEPVVSLCCDGEFIYSSTLDSVFKIPAIPTSHSPDPCEHGGLFTKIRCRKVAIYKNLLILQQSLQITFLGHDLSLMDVSIFQLEIRSLEVHQDSLFIGFSCGLLVEYDLNEISTRLTEACKAPTVEMVSMPSNKS